MATPEELIAEVSPYYKNRKALKKNKAVDSIASREYKLMYDSSSETLEPVYFWILDFMGTLGLDIEKLVDSFAASPGSGHFMELRQRAASMQQQASKLMGDVNVVIKSIQNIIYDLKEFQIRLKQYDDANSKDESKKSVGYLGLKQIWMDQVDFKKGQGSITLLVRDLNFITLRDAFMTANSINDAEKLDLNDRVKRILIAKLQEFIEWKKLSETELRKRYEIEKTYLKSQVNAVKLYSQWAKPYLVAAEQLRAKSIEETRYNPSIVNVFNTLYLQLTLFAKSKIDVANEAANKNIPEEFKNVKMRDYYQCVLVDFTFRGIPRNVGQHYAFGGRTEVTFRSYALNQDEIDFFKAKLEESEFSEALTLVQGMTEESLGQLKADIDEFLEEGNKEKEKEEKQEVNPFMALLGLGGKSFFKKGKTDEEKRKEKIIELKKKGVKKDSHAESVVRKLGETGADGLCYTTYDVYKKAHGMASAPAEGFNIPK